MGEVYRARDARLGRDVALKILPESFASDVERLHRFEQESRAVAALNHPNILAIYDVGTHNGAPFLVSELLEGESLRALLERGALSQRKVIHYGVQIAQGLAAAHDKGIIHRDLKPENLFITKEGRAKILDFGLAKLALAQSEAASGYGATMTGAATVAGVVMGTASYMAPEQVRGETVDPRTDIFALGAVLFEMISGRQVFHRDTAAETMTAVLKEDVPELEVSQAAIAPALDRIVRRCLEKSAEQRFQSAKDLSFALGVLSGTEVSGAVRRASRREKANSMVMGDAGIAGGLGCRRELVAGDIAGACEPDGIRDPRRWRSESPGNFSRWTHVGLRRSRRQNRRSDAVCEACGDARDDRAGGNGGRELSVLGARRWDRRILCEQQARKNCDQRRGTANAGQNLVRARRKLGKQERDSLLTRHVEPDLEGERGWKRSGTRHG